MSGKLQGKVALVTGAAQAAQPSLDRTVTRDLATTPAAGFGGQRFELLDAGAVQADNGALGM